MEGCITQKKERGKKKMIDQQTRKTIGEILKDQSQTKDMILYDLLIDGSINVEENAKIQKVEIENEKSNSNVADEEKPVFRKGCKKVDCVFSKDGFCTSNDVNGRLIKCDINTNYAGFKER